MIARPSLVQGIAGAGDSPAVEQFHVTHCLYDQGLQRQAGFGVRAASTSDPLLLRFAQEFPGLELPPGVACDADEAPRRLALARLPGGPAVLIHTVALAPDRHGRGNNYFSHVLALAGLGPGEALATWGSPYWATDCPAGAGKELPRLDDLPGGGVLDDRAITEFLQPALAADSHVVTSGLCPSRLAGDQAGRRRLLARVLQGCLLVLQAPPGTARGRLYLAAEPGLVALVLRAAARLLPPPLATGLTFSTYENARGLLTYRHGLVVGTCFGEGGALEDVFFQARGYAIDTFQDRCSPELDGEQEPAIREWLELAARGEWKVVGRVYALLGRGAAAVPSFQESLQAARLAQRLVKGQADDSDLHTLRDAPWGAALLAEHGHRLLPLLRQASAKDAGAALGYSGLLPGHTAQLESELTAALRGEPPGDWLGPWRLLRAAWHDQPGKLREALNRALPGPPASPELRLALLKELHEQELCPGNCRQPLHTLLRRCSAGELAELARSGLPGEWYVWALCYALLVPETQAEATRLLLAGDDELVRALWRQLGLLREHQQRHAIVAPLLERRSTAENFLGRSLQARAGIPPRTLAWALDRLGAWQPDWRDFWSRDGHLGQLLEQLPQHGLDAGPVWQRLFGWLDAGLLLGDAPLQTTLLGLLVGLRHRAGLALPPEVSGRIADWVRLREHFESAGAVPAEERQALGETCQRLGIDPVATLRLYFERYLLPQEGSGELLDDFAGFFHGFFPEPASSPEHAARLSAWLDVVGCCPDEERQAVLQGYYLEHHVPAALRQRLAEEARQAGKLLAGALRPAPLPAGAAPAPGPERAVPPVPAGGVQALFSELARGGPWLLASLAGGTLAALGMGPGTPLAQKLALLAAFLPLVVGLADAASRACPPSQQPGWARAWLASLLAGTAAAAGGGILAAGLALVVGAPSGAAVWLGRTAGAGMLAGAAAGLLLPLAGSAARLPRRLTTGPVARLLADGTAAVVYLLLARSLLA